MLEIEEEVKAGHNSFAKVKNHGTTSSGSTAQPRRVRNMTFKDTVRSVVRQDRNKWLPYNSRPIPQTDTHKPSFRHRRRKTPPKAFSTATLPIPSTPLPPSPGPHLSPPATNPPSRPRMAVAVRTIQPKRRRRSHVAGFKWNALVMMKKKKG